MSALSESSGSVPYQAGSQALFFASTNEITTCFRPACSARRPRLGTVTDGSRYAANAGRTGRAGGGACPGAAEMGAAAPGTVAEQAVGASRASAATRQVTSFNGHLRWRRGAEVSDSHGSVAAVRGRRPGGPAPALGSPGRSGADATDAGA